jgi:vitamin B12 transporter
LGKTTVFAVGLRIAEQLARRLLKLIVEFRYARAVLDRASALLLVLLLAPCARAEPETAATGVVIHGASRSSSLRRSANPVEVVELDREQRHASDLGEVLARSTSLGVRREGGLGSIARYSLNGLSGERVRFFVDGIPMELTGYQLGVANVPLNLVQRAEVYHGVVPARFGADALGGAVHLVSDEDVRSDAAGVAYELGSFETHRLSLGGRRYFARQKAFVRGSAFLDRSANDYPVDAQVFAEDGSVSTARVRRFHDGYRGAGVTLAAGVIDRPWANRLIIEGFGADYAREIQHNPAMTVPYGEVTYGRRAAGANVRFSKRLSEGARVDAVAGYAFRHAVLHDESRCRYDWYGRCFVELPLSGEMDAVPVDRRIDEHTGFVRAVISVAPFEAHQLRLAVAPTEVLRDGRDAAIPTSQYDPLRAERRISRQIVGLEYEIEAGPIAALSFAKVYRDRSDSQARLPTGAIHAESKRTLVFGAGDGLRVSIAEHAYAKASYEYAARLPTPDELFGDGGLIVDNVELEPERSHNYNLALVVDDAPTALGLLRGRVAGALRRIEDLILPLNRGSYYEYDNVLAASALAFDAALGYTAPGGVAGLDASVGLEDVRNTSERGPGRRFSGDRIPNLPYSRAAASAFARLAPRWFARDELELAWNVRYVGAFLLGWESAGRDEIKLETPSQTVHGVSLAYAVTSDSATLTSSFEVQNLSDASAFDFYGVPRPGRSFHLKMTANHE